MPRSYPVNKLPSNRQDFCSLDSLNVSQILSCEYRLDKIPWRRRLYQAIRKQLRGKVENRAHSADYLSIRDSQRENFTINSVSCYTEEVKG